MPNEAKKIIALILGISPLILLGFLFNKYALNIPHWDDHALRYFIINWQATPNYFEKLKHLFALHNEHRIVFTRIVSWLIFKINGTIDYRIMMIVGNASLIGIWLYFIKCTVNYKLSGWYISVVGWLLFSFAIAENLFWGMASVQNFWVIFWAFTTFYLLVFGKDTDIQNPFIKKSQSFLPKKRAFDFKLITAFLVAFLAIFTSGNGVLVPIIGGLVLLVQKRFRTVLLWYFVFGIIILIHFTTYTARPDEINALDEVSVNAFIKGVSMLAGAVFDTDWAFPSFRFDVAQAVGGIVIIVVSILLLRRLLVNYLPANNTYVILKRKTDLFLSACILFVMGTILGIVLSRAGYGVGVFLTGKYKIFSVLLLIICIIYSARLINKKYRNIGVSIAVGLSLFLWVNSYLNDYQFVLNQYMQRKVDLANWKMEAKNNNTVFSDYPYKAPEINLFENLNFNEAKNDTSLIDNVQLHSEEVVFIENDLDAVKQRIYFILKSPKNSYLFSTQPQRNKSRIGIFENYFQNGFLVNIPRAGMKTDLYQSYILIRTEKGDQKLLTNKKLIRVDGLEEKTVQKNW